MISAGRCRRKREHPFMLTCAQISHMMPAQCCRCRYYAYASVHIRYVDVIGTNNIAEEETEAIGIDYDYMYLYILRIV